MAEKDKEKDEPEKLVPVGDGAEEATEETPDKKDDEKEEESSEETSDERVGKSEDEEEEESEEGKTDPEREAIRARRRTERHNRRQREARERRELVFLRKRNEDVERQISQLALRQDQNEAATIDQRIGQIEGQIKVAESLHTKAVEKGDGATATEALSVRDGFREHLSKLREAKTHLETKSKEKKPADREEPTQEVDPLARENMSEWFGRNKWFDRSLQDPDSRLAKSLEDHLFAEGEYDPTDPEYWNELDRRVARVLPNRVKAKEKSTETEEREEKIPAKKKGGGPRFTTGGRERSLKPNEVYIDKQRREALQEAGLWDDEETRERYLRSYKSYDDEARNTK